MRRTVTAQSTVKKSHATMVAAAMDSIDDLKLAFDTQTWRRNSPSLTSSLAFRQL